MGSRLYLFEGSGNLTRNDAAKFQKKSLKTFYIVFMSYINDLLSSIALKFETTWAESNDLTESNILNDYH